MFKTRISELLGIEYPIMMGAMAYVGNPELVAAVSNAGGLGTLTSADCNSKEELRAKIRATSKLTKKPFGVNLSLFPSFRTINNDDFIDVMIDEGVKVAETSGITNPAQFIKRLKENNIKCIHKCTQVKHAVSAQDVGADVVTLVGFEQGGAMGPVDITTMVLIPLAIKSIKIPVFAAGGIADAHSFAAALSLGADGVVMGTRFVVTKESPVHQNVKQLMMNSKVSDTVITTRSVGNPHRALRNKTVDQVIALEAKGTTIEELAPFISGSNMEEYYGKGNLDKGICFVGQVVENIRELKSCKEVIDEMINGARDIYIRLNSIAANA